jgi:hypothetical protein
MARRLRNSYLLFLVAAAGFGGRSLAQTADGGEHVQRVHNPCQVYGAGFVAVSGTQTCVRIGGHVHVQLGVGRPIEFDRASPLDTPHADLSGPGLVQGGDTIPAGLQFDGAPPN